MPLSLSLRISFSFLVSALKESNLYILTLPAFTVPILIDLRFIEFHCYFHHLLKYAFHSHLSVKYMCFILIDNKNLAQYSTLNKNLFYNLNMAHLFWFHNIACPIILHDPCFFILCICRNTHIITPCFRYTFASLRPKDCTCNCSKFNISMS